MFYRTCPHCGCNLDPQERCDCMKEQERRADREQKAAESRKEEKERGKDQNGRA